MLRPLPIIALGAMLAVTAVMLAGVAHAQPRRQSDYPVGAFASSWDDLTAGVATEDDWNARRADLRQRFLDLIRDQHKPTRPPLELQIHERTIVDDAYERRLVSYQVEPGERARAFVAVPLHLNGKAPAVVALHGTFERGIEQAAGLVDDPDKAYLDHLARRGYVAIAPEHFVSGERVPPEGPYDTKRFYEKHPEWTAVGKFTFEHSIAVDVLAAMDEVDDDRIGCMGHSLGGHGAIFLAAYDERIKAAACNCGATFFRHNPKVAEWARDRWYVYFKHLRPAIVAGDLPPIDFHEIIALIAPRAFLDVSGLNDGDPAVQRHRILMLTSVMRVYDLVGAPQNFAFFIHGHGHAVPPESRDLIYGWLDAHLKSKTATPKGSQ